MNGFAFGLLAALLVTVVLNDIDTSFKTHAAAPNVARHGIMALHRNIGGAM